MSLKREGGEVSEIHQAIKIMAIEDSKRYPLLNQDVNVAKESSYLTTATESYDNEYVNLEEIGRGGFSIVYKSQHRLTKSEFAVKVDCHLVFVLMMTSYDPGPTGMYSSLTYVLFAYEITLIQRGYIGKLMSCANSNTRISFASSLYTIAMMLSML
jgi:serine/threonine protein kinase